MTTVTPSTYKHWDVFTPPDPVKGDQATEPVTSKGTLSSAQKNSVEMALNYALGYVTQGKTYASEGRMAVYVEHDDNASSFYIKGSENADGTSFTVKSVDLNCALASIVIMEEMISKGVSPIAFLIVVQK